MSGLLAAYLRESRTRPLRTSVAQSIITSVLGKLISDRLRGKSKATLASYDLAVFAAHGAFAGLWFGKWFPKLEAIVKGLLGKDASFGAATLLKTVVHCFIQNPVFLIITLVYLKLALPRPYWAGKSGIEERRKKKSENEDGEWSQRLASVARVFPSALRANIRLWVPATLINLSVVPPHLRALFGAVVALLWNVQLAMRSSGSG